MVWTDKVRQLKLIFIGVAIVIVATSLFVSHWLVEDLKIEERARMEVWAEAMRSLTEAEETTDLNLVLTVINGNNSIPVIVTDEENRVLTHRNLQLPHRDVQDSLKSLQNTLTEMQQSGKHMQMPLEFSSQDVAASANEGRSNGQHFLNIYYDESLILRRLVWFPYVQLGVVSLFLLVALLALLSTKRAEQNRVWVGLTKETAHQLGTPISSLMAWIEVLKETYPDEVLFEDMQTDVQRLERITERFSKIGSQPELKTMPIVPIVEQTLVYLHRRISNRVALTSHFSQDTSLPLCAPLFEWVIEVLCKNAVDAMSGAGSIEIHGQLSDKHYVIDVKDSGKGIARKHFSSIFKAGYTTKQRGWGLGLSLSKRIIEEYHHGRIYVLQSVMGEGTTFRIELPLQA